jgi:hypothetical protein
MRRSAKVAKNNHGEVMAIVFSQCLSGTFSVTDCFGRVLRTGFLLAMLGSISPAMGQDLPTTANPATQVANKELASVGLTSQAKDAIRAEVRQRLIDLESARFRWLEKTTDGKVYCGFVNSKNRMGGYVGFVPFQVFLAKAKNGEVGAAFLSMSDGDPKSSASRVTVETCQESGNNLAGPTTEDTPAE